MPRDQIYSSQPSDELFQKLLEAFGIMEINIDQTFSRIDLQNKNTLLKLANLVPYLKECYLPCKARTYLNDLTYKNIITILRHALKTRGFTVLSREKYHKGRKYIHYRLVHFKRTVPDSKNIKKAPNTTKKDDLIVTFN